MQPTISNNVQWVPEDVVRYCAATLIDTEKHPIFERIKEAEELRQAGLTPVYLCQESLKNLFVTTKERLEKQLH